jgi:hypothetical protein
LASGEAAWAESKIHVRLRFNSSWRLLCERQNVEFAAESNRAARLEAAAGAYPAMPNKRTILIVDDDN